MDRWRRESTQPKTTTWSTDLSYAAEDEFVELVWENGQVLMQGQSSRARRTSTSNNFQSQIPKIRDKDLCNATNSKWGKSGLMDSVLHDFTAAVPSGEIGLEQEDDIVPWLNYPFDDSLQHDYCSELLPELSGVTVSELSADKRNSCNQSMRGLHGGSASNVSSLDLANQLKVSSSEFGESSRSVSGQLYPWSLHESRTPVPFVRPGVSSIMGNSTCNSRHAGCGDSTKAQASTCFPVTKIQKQDSGLPNADSDVMNFSHFSRPAAVVRANLQNVGAMASPGTVGIEGMGGKNRVPAPCSSNLAESTLLNLNCGIRTEMNSLIQPNSVPLKGDSKQVAVKPLEELRTAENAEAECREDAFRNDMLPNQVLGAATSKGMPDGEKTVEPAVASSSVCSGNSAERASNEPVHNLKRKDRETDDSEGRSHDVEEESVGIRKAAPAQGGKGCKRSRAAEVHNLSERRRRDRINEKMRALQELIPNCNKVDKASMLDEAIEYLKTLQLQVQIMSMGAGMYMPPMMFPGGMQQIHAAHMARFSPLGVGMGMGMGMGFGMGMLDMNGGSPGPGRPIFQAPPMQGAHFPIPHPPPVLGLTNFQGMAGPNLHVYGHPSHSLPVSAPRSLLVPLSGGPPVNSSMELNACGMAVPGEVPNPSPPPNSKDLIQDANSQMMYNPDANSPVKQTSGQCQATKEGFEQTSLVLKTDQAPDDGSREDANLTRENDILP